MPELPEVEGARRLAHEHTVGRRIVEVVATEVGGGPRDGKLDDKVIGDKLGQAELTQALVGRTVTSTGRHGKHMWLEMDGTGPCLLLHYGMTGALVVRGVEPLSFMSFTVSTEWPPRFTKLLLRLSPAAEVAFVDARRLGKVLLRQRPVLEPPISLLAQDPLSDGFSLERLAGECQGHRCPIKSLLLDQQKAVCGVGNWIADEVLLEAAVHPEAAASSLSERQVTALHKAILHVVRTAVGVNANADEFPKHWLFHRRWGRKPAEQVTQPDGSAISFSTVGGRSTLVVDEKQFRGESAPLPRAKRPAAAAAAESAPPAAKRPARAGRPVKK